MDPTYLPAERPARRRTRSRLARIPGLALLAALALATSYAAPLAAQDDPHGDAAGPALFSLTAEQWRHDVETLRREAPQVHADLFHTLSEAEWNRRLDELSTAVGEMSAAEIVLELARLVAAVGDGHTELWIGPYQHRLGFRQLPVRFYRFADGIRVQAVREANAAWLGARVVAVGGVPVEEAVERLEPLLARDSEYYLDTYAVVQTLNNLGALHGVGLAAEDHAVYTLRTAGGETVEARFEGGEPIPGLRRWSLEPDRHALAQEEGEPWVFALSEERHDRSPRFAADGRAFGLDFDADRGELRLDLNLIRNDGDRSLADLARELDRRLGEGGVERLVIDLRDNGGGNNQLNLPLVHAVIRHPEIDRPDRLFVLIGRHTFSAASHLVTAFETHTHATFVGEPTGASPNHYGDSDPVELPESGLAPRFSTLYWQNAVPWDHRAYTAPHLAVDLTWEDYLAGRDAAYEVIRRPGLATRVTDAALRGDGSAEEAHRKLRELLDDPLHRHQAQFAERDLNQLGYRLLGEDRVAEAVRVFRVANLAFPESANTHDSLGEALVRAGDLDAARAAFRRAVELDPDGGVGRSSRHWLRRLAEGHTTS